MMGTTNRHILKTIRTALLVAGSAFCICACNGAEEQEEETNEGLLTMEGFDVTIIESNNGKLENRFETPLIEEYAFAREPYREYRKGVKVTSYNTATGEIESTLVADYAIQFTELQLWEAKGNVVATNAKGHTLETQQLFWNQRTERIYSNIDTKITQGTEGSMIGVGFESDQQLYDWEFRRPRGTTDVDVNAARTPGEGVGDDEAADQPAEPARINTSEADTGIVPGETADAVVQADVEPEAISDTEIDGNPDSDSRQITEADTLRRAAEIQ